MPLRSAVPIDSLSIQQTVAPLAGPGALAAGQGGADLAAQGVARPLRGLHPAVLATVRPPLGMARGVVAAGLQDHGEVDPGAVGIAGNRALDRALVPIWHVALLVAEVSVGNR